MERFYVVARPDGWDFFSGNTLNFREHIGQIVERPITYLISSDTARNINDCFFGESKIPCSAYIIEGELDKEIDNEKDIKLWGKKCGVSKFKIISEIYDLETAFGWKYQEAINPIQPLEINNKLTDKHINLLDQWACIRNSKLIYAIPDLCKEVGLSDPSGIRKYIQENLHCFSGLFLPIWDKILYPIWEKADKQFNRYAEWYPARDSIRDQVWAYLGSLFWGIKKDEPYPFQSGADLWSDGFIATNVDCTWHIHSGLNADIICRKLIKKGDSKMNECVTRKNEQIASKETDGDRDDLIKELEAIVNKYKSLTTGSNETQTTESNESKVPAWEKRYFTDCSPIWLFCPFNNFSVPKFACQEGPCKCYAGDGRDEKGDYIKCLT